MTQFLVKPTIPRGRRERLLIADNLTVRYPRRHKPTGKLIGGFTEVTDAGAYRDRLEVKAHGIEDPLGTKLHRRAGGKGTRYRPALRADGTRANSADPFYVHKTAAEVKKHVRILRDQEAEKIGAIDVEIETHQAAIKVLREERSAAAKEAWSRGNVVRLQDLVALADEKEATRS